MTHRVLGDGPWRAGVLAAVKNRYLRRVSIPRISAKCQPPSSELNDIFSTCSNGGQSLWVGIRCLEGDLCPPFLHLLISGVSRRQSAGRLQCTLTHPSVNFGFGEQGQSSECYQVESAITDDCDCTTAVRYNSGGAQFFEKMEGTVDQSLRPLSGEKPAIPGRTAVLRRQTRRRLDRASPSRSYCPRSIVVWAVDHGVVHTQGPHWPPR